MSARRDLLVALNAAPAIRRAAICRLAAELDRWWPRGGDPERLARRLGVPATAMTRALAAAAGAGRSTAGEHRRARAAGARLVVRGDPAYPAALEQLTLPPPVLYVRGELPAAPAAPAVAVVGSRRATVYGREAAGLFGRGLAAAGVVVVSGFARGVDAAAHRGALAGGGDTVAVLGCGVDVDYPRGQRRLAAEVAGHGALISELPCGSAPRPWHFPVRNRIIAALASTTLVVQAAPRSGSLITARLALELGRDVFAVPGSIFDERSLGTHALLADGAGVARHPRDLVESLPDRERRWLERRAAAGEGGGGPAAGAGEAAPEEPPGAPTGLAGRLLAQLTPGEPRPPEPLAEVCGAPVERVLAALLELELGGWVRRFAGPAWSRRS